MYIQAVIGELLYIGIVAEKGRCYGRKWGFGYKKILRKHVIALNELQKCLKSSDEEIFRITIEKFIALCNENHEIGKFYCFSSKKLKHISRGKEYKEVDILINELFVELIKEIKKPFIKKRKVYDLLCALHNLPRVYLGREANTLCNLRQEAISEKDAIEYAISNMKL